MLCIRVQVPVASFRKGLAREYLETERIPPPSTCYGFLLSLVGESHRERHIGVRVTPLLLREPGVSVVLRTVWRVKNKTLGAAGNTRPDYQQLLTGLDVMMWVDSSQEEHETPTLEDRIREALTPTARHRIQRFGGLSLGESTHLVDTVDLIEESDRQKLLVSLESDPPPRIYRVKEQGLLGLPVWVDHVGSNYTQHVVGDLVPCSDLAPPPLEEMPRISPGP